MQTKEKVCSKEFVLEYYKQRKHVEKLLGCLTQSTLIQPTVYSILQILCSSFYDEISFVKKPTL